MIDTLYIEEEVADHPRVLSILARFPDAGVVYCERYGEVFNRRAQNFRLQKTRPALILAKKHRQFVLPAPENYAIGGERNFYFSHMLNCLYDCRYCFLQGMYRSAHYVLFVNFEDFSQALEQTICAAPDKASYFFSGYDCDSLALEPVTGFASYFLPFFRRHSNAWIELRTKSTQIRSLLEMEPFERCVAAFSLSPENITQALEAKTPRLERRLDAIVKLQQQGWPIGLRFDPLIYHDDFRKSYQNLFEQVFSRIDVDTLHSVSLGNFRMPESYFANIVRLYPDEALFAGPLTTDNGMVSYSLELEQDMMAFCERALAAFIPKQIFFPCH